MSIAQQTILEGLCVYDSRNPNYMDPALYGCDPTPAHDKDCACDPCFRGKDELAVALLDASATVASLRTRLAADEAERDAALLAAYESGYRDCERKRPRFTVEDGWDRHTMRSLLTPAPAQGPDSQEVRHG